MKIREAIEQTDRLKPNMYEQRDKIGWLSRLDEMVKKNIIDTHEGGEKITFAGYDENTELDTQLLVPAPHDEMYLRWLEAQIEYANGEYGRYNNAVEMFQTVYDGYANQYNRTHTPLSKSIKYF